MATRVTSVLPSWTAYPPGLMGLANAIGRLLGSRTPRGTDFYDLAERERRVPEAELSVAEAVLAGGPIISSVVGIRTVFSSV